MIGIYDYTVILTYLSLASAVCGITISSIGNGHPYAGGFFLLFCGLCDTFDGKVARSKKNRTEREKDFGVQIDSLSDLVAFGVLPASIALSLVRFEGRRFDVFNENGRVDWYLILYFIVIIFYVLAALIRLAFFNVLAEEAKREGKTNTDYVGLPVTMAALIFPLLLFLNYYFPQNLSMLYIAALIVTGFLFLGKFRIRKPGWGIILCLLAIGAVEFLLLIILHVIR